MIVWLRTRDYQFDAVRRLQAILIGLLGAFCSTSTRMRFRWCKKNLRRLNGGSRKLMLIFERETTFVSGKTQHVHAIHETPMHTQKVTLCCALWSSEPYFLKTVKSKQYQQPTIGYRRMTIHCFGTKSVMFMWKTCGSSGRCIPWKVQKSHYLT